MSKEKLKSMEEEIRLFFDRYEKDHEGEQLTPHQIAFDEQLRTYRDLKNVIETAREEGRRAGLEKARRKAQSEAEAKKQQLVAQAEAEKQKLHHEKQAAEKRMKQSVIKMLFKGLSVEDVAELFDLSVEEVQAIKQQNQH